MNEITSNPQASITPIEVLAEEARLYSESMAMNMLNLGRVFTEAKRQILHGKWGEWVQRNSGMGMRSAQQLMAIYDRFGSKPAFVGIEKSKMYKMLALPKGKEDEFAAENDLTAMTSREVEEAVRRVREQAKREIEKEREARLAAERRAEEAENRPLEIPPELTDELTASRETIAKQRAEVERLATAGTEALAEQRRLSRENADLQREIRERDDLLAEQQEDINRAQQELLNVQSAIAKGDAERVPADQLTPDAFASAVRAFIGTVARMPHMRMVFAAMPCDQKQEYSVLLETVEKWAEESRKALDTTMIDGTVIYSE